MHRVGRVARAGRRGAAYSLVAGDELALMLDLHLFLGRVPAQQTPTADFVLLYVGWCGAHTCSFLTPRKRSPDAVYYGCLPQAALEETMVSIHSAEKRRPDLAHLRSSAANAHKLYVSTVRPVLRRDVSA